MAEGVGERLTAGFRRKRLARLPERVREHGNFSIWHSQPLNDWSRMRLIDRATAVARKTTMFAFSWHSPSQS